MIRTFIKKVRLFIALGNKKKAQDAFYKMQSIVDKYANKGLIHKNKAARYKSVLSLKIKSICVN
ncbi:MAG: 30S ribosomal protein S20, partial [Candidatus Blochmannia sp. A2]|nr:30S ribosomal protein S20 [Candidatus Blochmannia sp. A2]